MNEHANFRQNKSTDVINENSEIWERTKIQLSKHLSGNHAMSV